MLVLTPEPSEKGKQRPRNVERYLPEQCDHALHADKRRLHQNVQEGNVSPAVSPPPAGSASQMREGGECVLIAFEEKIQHT